MALESGNSKGKSGSVLYTFLIRSDPTPKVKHLKKQIGDKKNDELKNGDVQRLLMSTTTTTTTNKTDDSNVRKEITLGGITYILTGTVNFEITPKGDVPPVVDPENPPKPDTPKDFGTIKQGGKWTLNPGKAETWILKQMDNPNTEWKFISATDQKNIIANIKSEAEAKAIQEFFKVNVFPPKGNDPSDPVDPDQPPQPSVVGTDFPYESTGKTVEMSQRGPTIRHYASGKDDDNTIEKNAKKIPFDNIQASFQIEVPAEWEHNDNLGIKIGGTHMGSGWFDNGIDVYEGRVGLGKEEKHPSTQLNVVKGKVYGDLRGKTVQVATTYFKKSNKTEYWVNIPGVTQGWDKGCEGTDVGGFHPKNDGETEVQLRIDGFKELNKPPKILKFAVSEIKV